MARFLLFSMLGLMVMVLGIGLHPQSLEMPSPTSQLQSSSPQITPDAIQNSQSFSQTSSETLTHSSNELSLEPSPERFGERLPEILSIDLDRLLQFLQNFSSERFSDAGRAQARVQIEQYLSQWGWQVEEQTFAEGINLIARPPVSPTSLPDFSANSSNSVGNTSSSLKSTSEPAQAPTLLLAAHYDTVPDSPGADDNGTGVGVLLEVARLFTGVHLPKPLELVFFDQEERGLKGSFAFVVNPNNQADLETLEGAIVLDMLGYACYQPGCQTYPAGLPVEPPSLQGDFLAIVGDLEHLPFLQTFRQVESPILLYTLPVPFKGVLMPDVLRSDHAAFWLSGVGAVLVTDTGDLRNPHYHQASDRPETLDRDFLAASAQAIVDTVLILERMD